MGFRKLGAALALALLVGGIAPVGVAEASTVTCGAVIVQDTTLDSDVGPCPGGGLIIGADDVVLDLGGHAVSGSGSGDGILVLGRDARIQNGTIAAFDRGVSTRQERGTFDRLVLTANDCHGIDMGIGASRNVVSRSVVTRNGCGGIRIFRAQFNAVVGSSVASNGGVGIAIESLGGIITAARSNRLAGNAIYANASEGVYVSEGSVGTTVEASSIRSNGGHGVYVGARFSAVRVRDNVIVSNSRSGVRVDDGFPSPLTDDPNEVHRNTALQNGALGGFDLADENAGCAGTVWAQNQFLTRNQGCIQ
jgi:hypothetical protein